MEINKAMYDKYKNITEVTRTEDGFIMPASTIIVCPKCRHSKTLDHLSIRKMPKCEQCHSFDLIIGGTPVEQIGADKDYESYYRNAPKETLFSDLELLPHLGGVQREALDMEIEVRGLREEAIKFIAKLCILCKGEYVDLVEYHCDNKKNIIMICKRCHNIIHNGISD